jgi:hypothetical protein
MDVGADRANGQQLVARVETVPLIAVAGSLRDGEIRMAVQPRLDGVPAIRYLEAAAGAPRGRDLVAAVSLGIIKSSDELMVQEARLEGDRLFLRVQLRDFQGRLAANVLRLAIVVVELKDLAPGTYRVEVCIDRSVFTEYEHPATATYEGSSSHQLHFEVAGD